MYNFLSFFSWQLLVLFLSILDISNPHAIYIGTIKMEHHEAQDNTLIKIKVFSDDLQNVIKHAYSMEQLLEKNLLCGNKERLQQYFNQHLQIWINGKIQPLEISHCETINDVHLLSFGIHSPIYWNTFRVRANFLMELFPTQSNIIQLHYTKKMELVPQSFFGRMSKEKEILEFTL